MWSVVTMRSTEAIHVLNLTLPAENIAAQKHNLRNYLSGQLSFLHHVMCSAQCRIDVTGAHPYSNRLGFSSHSILIGYHVKKKVAVLFHGLENHDTE